MKRLAGRARRNPFFFREPPAGMKCRCYSYGHMHIHAAGLCDRPAELLFGEIDERTGGPVLASARWVCEPCGAELVVESESSAGQDISPPYREAPPPPIRQRRARARPRPFSMQSPTIRGFPGYLDHLRSLGFDASYPLAFSRRFRVACSLCEPRIVGGVPRHEAGCPNGL